MEVFIKICVFATFLAPLVLLPSKFIFPFIVPKIIFFRALSILIFGSYILLLASHWPWYKIKITFINIVVGLFFLSFAISTFVGADWYRSFWDNHERMLGLFTIFHYVIYYFVVTSVVKEWKDWKWLLRLFLMAGSVVMFIGVLQKLSPELLLNMGNNRVSATLGNPIYYSGYGLFLFYIGHILFWKESVKSWKYFAAIGGALGFLGVFLGGTRGTLLGLIASIGVLAICYLFVLKEHKKIRRAIGVVIIASIAIFGLLFGFRQARFVQAIPAVGRLLNTPLVEGTGATRMMAWEIAVEALREKPVFGWGPNNYYYAFNKFYRPEFLERGWGETWFDNAHSAVFNTLAVQGIIGLLAYAGLFVFAFIQLLQDRKKGNVDAHIFSIGTAFLAGHFVHNAVVFENPTSFLYFFFFLAFVNSLSARASDSELPIKIEGGKVSAALIAIVGVAVLLIIYSTDINVARANMASLKSLQAFSTGKLAADAYRKAAEISSPHIDDIRSDFVRSLNMAIPQYVSAGMSDQARDLYRLGYDESKKNLALHPLDIRTHLQFAQLIQQGVMALKEPAQSLVEAETALKDAFVKSPKRQQIVYQLAMLELLMNKSGEAASLLQTAIADDNKISEGWWRLALVYLQSGNIEEAKKTIKTAQDSGVSFDNTGREVIFMISQASEEALGKKNK